MAQVYKAKPTFPCGCTPQKAQQISENSFMVFFYHKIYYLFILLGIPWNIITLFPIFNNPNHRRYWIGLGISINISIAAKSSGFDNISYVAFIGWIIIIALLFSEQYIESTYIHQNMGINTHETCPCCDQLLCDDDNNESVSKHVINSQKSFDEDRIIFKYIFMSLCAIFGIGYGLFKYFALDEILTDEMMEQIMNDVWNQIFLPFSI